MPVTYTIQPRPVEVLRSEISRAGIGSVLFRLELHLRRLSGRIEVHILCARSCVDLLHELVNGVGLSSPDANLLLDAALQQSHHN